MKKSDLKVGYVVKRRNGTKNIVLKNEFGVKEFLGKKGSREVDDYEEDLTIGVAELNGFDIVKVKKNLDLYYGLRLVGLAEKEETEIKWDWVRPEKVKLTANEKAILESLPEAYAWIARDLQADALYIYGNKPKKTEFGQWIVDESWSKGIQIFNHLFQFIKWEDEGPVNIKELLEDCEVIKNEE